MDYSRFRHGSAGPASLRDLRRAGIIGTDRGAPFGFDQTLRHQLRVPTDGSVAIWGGTGSGKSASIFSTNLVANAVRNSVCFDPRGELTAISMLAASLDGYEMFVFNPTGMLDLPQHGTNPLDHLAIDSPSLIADCQKAAMDLVPASIGRDGKPHWWEAEAQDWLTQILLYLSEAP